MVKQTPLYAFHAEHARRMGPFAGWQMPIEYAGTVSEHRAVRSTVGIFDVSHMGEIALRGKGAEDSVQRIITNDVRRLTDDGMALYTVICDENGGIIDDCIVYRRAPRDYLIVVNASNIAADLAWIRAHAEDETEVADESDATALIAVQGPEAVPLLSSMADRELGAVRRFNAIHCKIAGIPCFAARTGYTGEDGFELACMHGDAPALWNALFARGATPVGLGARDTLRLEACYCLHGTDISRTVTPLEAGLGWVVKFEAGEFIGREALLRQRDVGIQRSLVRFRISEGGIARHGYAIMNPACGNEPVGEVTSGTMGISVRNAIGLGYVQAACAAPETPLTINCRGKSVTATVVKGPFYERGAPTCS